MTIRNTINWHHFINFLSLSFIQVLMKNVGTREQLSYTYIRGKGIEIGALNRPLPLFHGSTVTYIDHLSSDKLRKHYPELRSANLINPDIIDEGERLVRIRDESCDFVIANHFLEHCEDPVMAIKSFSRVLKKKGILYLAVPDKEKTFDRLREVTSWEHLERDHIFGPDISRSEHYLDFSRYVMNNSDETCYQVAQDLIEKRYSIHFHVWDIGGYLDFLGRICKSESFHLLSLIHHADEMIAILKNK
jgi:SAM-dependent methyltransferase